MGISGARKTTLMDMLSGRKTNGMVEGETRVKGTGRSKKHMQEYQVTVSKLTYIRHRLLLKNQ